MKVSFPSSPSSHDPLHLPPSSNKPRAPSQSLPFPSHTTPQIPLLPSSSNSPKTPIPSTSTQPPSPEQPHLHRQSQPPSSSSLLAPSPSTTQQSPVSSSRAKASSTSPPSQLPSPSTPPTSLTSPPQPPPPAVSSPLPPPLPSPSPSPTAPSPTSTQNISNTIFSTCFVSEVTSSGGRGGALMIEYNDDSQVSSTTFSITNIVFSANKACVGRDMYFVCESFVASVKEPLFAFMGNITQKDNSVVGHDRTEAFGDWNVDLFIFLNGRTADNECVDGHLGIKAMYCWTSKMPYKRTHNAMGLLKKVKKVGK
ncbi:uncharacterized protein MONOS_11590 [Monocercomonoides exilis]|uniref:uncharacterized protein n=1 Tax=Monocercomonoides exilis TaxID=2049356 RepID=UPI00355A8A0E|nr:hypothetical protein MONOS_11590 [Monocercomonoides exilis]|eukprot:MONOS_11590.1-p1 / transcript=MONOS_11590.1 / gene=MONOS_11590 / organism=Monocercomonoides_exilis_PA203 / gene_product=unspecified product / transcript_product=unspecified product / location=Mono_scaffold00589:25378-26817(-) / protein_length=310 / sequence_SO=supercontig / SO=protein_coding / is_pseudo=false